MKFNVFLNVFLLGTVLFLGCSKDSQEELDLVTKGVDVIAPNIVGMLEYAGGLTKEAASLSTTIAQPVIDHNDGFYVEVNAKSNTKNSLQANSKAAAPPLKNFPFATLYKVIILNEDNEYVTEVLAKTGKEIEFDVKIKETYKVVAYTYNSRDLKDTLLYQHKIGNLEGNRRNIARPHMIPNREFYYASSPITVDKTGKKWIDLKFVPKMTRVGVELDTRGIFAKINGWVQVKSASNNFFKRAQFDLLDQSINDVVVSPTYQEVDELGNLKNPLPNYMTSGSVSTLDDMKTAYFYSAVDTDGILTEMNGQSESSVELTFSSTLGLEYIEAGISLENDKILNQKFKLKNGFRGLVNGKSKTFTYSVFRGFLFEYSPTKKLLWSVANLSYSGEKDNVYFFRKYAYKREGDGFLDYWGQNRLFPTDFTPTGIGVPTVGDPCSKVYPAGEWRLPRRAEFEELFTLNSSEYTRSNYQKDDNAPSRFNRYSLVKNNNTSSEIRFYYLGKLGRTWIAPNLGWTHLYENSQGIFEFKKSAENSDLYFYTGQFKLWDFTKVPAPAYPYKSVRCVREVI